MSSPIPSSSSQAPAIAPRSAGGISLKSRPHASVITVPPAIETRKMIGRYQAPLVAEASKEEADAVHDGREGDHAAQSEPVAEEARAGRGDDVACRDGRQHGRRRPQRLPEPDREVEDDERPRTGERALPRRVGDQEPAHVGIAVEDRPAVPR